MKKIIRSYNLEDKKEQYNTLNASAEKLSKHVGERIQVSKWALIENTNEDTGEVSYAFSCTSTDGERFGTNSRAFIEGLNTFLEIFGDDGLDSFEVGSRTSKSGRSYIYFMA